MTPLNALQRELIEANAYRRHDVAGEFRNYSPGLNSQDRMSIADEALCLAAQSWREDGSAPFGVYADVCIRNAIKRALGRIARRYGLMLAHRRELASEAGSPAHVERDFEVRESAALVRAALDCLTPNELRVVELMAAGVRECDLARERGVSRQSIQSYLIRARRKVRARLGRLSHP